MASVSPTAERRSDRAARAVAPAEDCGESAVLGYAHGRVGMLRAVLYADDRSLRQSSPTRAVFGIGLLAVPVGTVSLPVDPAGGVPR